MLLDQQGETAMTFTVTYRAASGARSVEVVEAANRADVFAKMKARGIKPLAIAEGGRTSSGLKQSASVAGRRTILRGVIAAAAVLVIALAAWFFLAPREKPTMPQTPPPKPKAVPPKPIAPKPAPVAVAPTNVVEVKTPPRKKRKYEDRLNPGDPGWDPKDHPYVLVYTNKPPENPEGGIAHRNGTEQVLDWIFSCNLGDPPGLCPTLPAAEMANIAQILEQGAELKADDSEQTIEHKTLIAAAKRELQEYVEKGGDPQNFVNYYHSQLMNYHQQYQDAQNMVLKAARETPEIAAELVKKVNAQLATKGIKPVIISKKMRERLGIPLE